MSSHARSCKTPFDCDSKRKWGTTEQTIHEKPPVPPNQEGSSRRFPHRSQKWSALVSAELFRCHPSNCKVGRDPWRRIHEWLPQLHQIWAQSAYLCWRFHISSRLGMPLPAQCFVSQDVEPLLIFSPTIRVHVCDRKANYSVPHLRIVSRPKPPWGGGVGGWGFWVLDAPFLTSKSSAWVISLLKRSKVASLEATIVRERNTAT